MRKVYKPISYTFGADEPVKIDNTVFVPTEAQAALSAEELERLKAQQESSEKQSFNDALRAEIKRLEEKKSGENERLRLGIIEEAKKDAAKIISEAKSNTAEIIEKTRAECAELKERAKKDGYDEGFKAGHSEANEKCSKYVDAAAKLISEINSRKEAYYLSNEQELKDTLMVMVERLTKAEIKSDGEVISRIIADAAKSFRNSDYLKISLADGEISRELKSDNTLIKQIIPYIEDIDIEILPDAEEGTVILDDDETIVDASVPTQLDFLREILNNTRSRSGDDEET